MKQRTSEKPSFFRNFGSQKGIALTEFIIVFPMLTTFIMGITEMSSALQTYLVMTQIAREGLRTAAALPKLESTQVKYENIVNVPDAYHCEPNQPTVATPSCENQLLVQRRMNLLLNILGAKKSVGSSLKITTQYITNSGGADADTVYVEMSGYYYGSVFQGKLMPFKVSAQGPYLYGR